LLAASNTSEIVDVLHVRVRAVQYDFFLSVIKKLEQLIIWEAHVGAILKDN
jgi:hypothetical protein